MQLLHSFNRPSPVKIEARHQEQLHYSDYGMRAPPLLNAALFSPKAKCRQSTLPTQSENNSTGTNNNLIECLSSCNRWSNVSSPLEDRQFPANCFATKISNRSMSTTNNRRTYKRKKHIWNSSPLNWNENWSSLSRRRSFTETNLHRNGCIK